MMQPALVASAMSELSLKWFLIAIPIVVISVLLFFILLWVFIEIKSRYESEGTILVEGVPDKEYVVDTISDFFYINGYRRVDRDKDRIFFAKDSRYNLVLGFLLLLFFVLPGFLYLIFFGKGFKGRIHLEDINDRYLVTIMGPKSVIDSADKSFKFFYA